MEVKETYGGHQLVQSQHEVGHVGEFEGSQPSVLVATDLVVDDHAEADGHIDGSESSKTDQGLLADTEPWRVADTKEDGLGDVRREGVEMVEELTWSSFLLFLGRSAVEEDIARLGMGTETRGSRETIVEGV